MGSQYYGALNKFHYVHGNSNSEQLTQMDTRRHCCFPCY